MSRVRWVRHPLYTTGVVLFVALGLIAANWFVLLFCTPGARFDPACGRAANWQDNTFLFRLRGEGTESQLRFVKEYAQELTDERALRSYRPRDVVWNTAKRGRVMTALRYPIGKFSFEGEPTDAQRRHWIEEIATAPAALRAAVAGLTPDQMNTPYRPGGWTVRQVVHHVPDSHLNAYVRFKLALTEDEPTIKPYDEARWAELADTRTVSPDVSLTLLESVHERWVALLRSMTPTDFRRTFRHPEHGRALTLEEVLAMYAWHGRHHVAHITALRQREGWS